MIKRQRMLAGAAVNIAEYVDRGGHALLIPTPQVIAMRAIAIDGAWGP